MNEASTSNQNTLTPGEENDPRKLLVLSLGTGQRIACYKATDAAKWGLLGWFRKDGKAPIIDMLMQSSTDMLDIQETFFFKAISKHTNYLRIQVLFFHTIYIYIYITDLRLLQMGY